MLYKFMLSIEPFVERTIPTDNGLERITSGYEEVCGENSRAGRITGENL